ncbi:MAG: DinB family protein [Bacteroidetes bacterium]|nr:DinB family protein [Bacteroidota bacterium]MCY4204567.1 DinB family protein [Bacteroidota bacterium]
MLRSIAFLLAAILALPAMAQDHSNSDYLDAITADFNGTSEKLNSLAQAISEDHFDWSPAEGVRSVVEVLNHVSDANFGIAASLGHMSDYEASNIDTKEGALARLSASQAHVVELLASLAKADLSTTTELFGMTINHYGAIGILTGHTHEHLGQLIAYARSNEIAPPWSGG